MVALVQPLLVPLRASDRELDLDLAPGELARQLEAEALEDPEHVPVVGEDLGDEAVDPLASSPQCELLDEARPDATPLVRVGDGESRLGSGRIAQPLVVPDCDDDLPPVLGERPEERAALDPVRLEELLDELRAEARKAVEAQVEAPLRECAEELHELLLVLSARRAEAQRRPVSQDDVGDVRSHSAHSRGCDFACVRAHIRPGSGCHGSCRFRAGA